MSNNQNNGNAAAMREALVEIRDICQRVGMGVSPLSKRYKSQECQAVNQCFRKAVAAISAPARNCDLLLVADGPANNNADKAWLFFKKYNQDAYFDVSGLLRCIDWLLAPAERKGEGDDTNC